MRLVRGHWLVTWWVQCELVLAVLIVLHCKHHAVLSLGNIHHFQTICLFACEVHHDCKLKNKKTPSDPWTSRTFSFGRTSAHFETMLDKWINNWLLRQRAWFLDMKHARNRGFPNIPSASFLDISTVEAWTNCFIHYLCDQCSIKSEI